MSNNRNLEITYLLDQWVDLGAGCCSDRKEYKLAAGAQNGLEACKKTCLKHEKCKYVEYGWKNSNWCFVVSSDASCSPLDAGPKPSCGSGGNDGVRVYEYRPGMYTF